MHTNGESPNIVKQVRALRPAHGGTCFSLVDGRPLFISGAIPGELVDVRVDSRRSKVSYGSAIDILEPSDRRVAHIWPEAAANGVGGADLGHIDFEYQREWKTEVIKDQLARVGGTNTLERVIGAVGEDALKVRPASDPRALNWRTRVDFEVSPARRLAMKKENSNELVEIETMPLAVEPILELGMLGDTPWKQYLSPGKKVRIVAPSGGGRRVVIGNQVFNGANRRVGDRADWEVRARGTVEKFSVASSGFWQAHVSAPADLVELVLDGARVQEGDAVIELYAGAGLFTKFLARELGPRGAIVSIEGSKEAVGYARENLRGVEVGRDLRTGRVNSKSIMRAWSDLGERPQAIVLDPPRSGAGKDVINALAAVGASRIVLVSCDPAAGARDLAGLFDAGYELEAFTALDLFPQTHHVEMVSVLTRK